MALPDEKVLVAELEHTRRMLEARLPIREQEDEEWDETFYKSYFENTKLSLMVREIGLTKKPKINKSICINNELKRKRTNSNCVSSFQFLPVCCLNYLINRTRIRRYPRASASSVQSVFHRIPSAIICVHLRLIFVSLSDRIREIQFKLFRKAQPYPLLSIKR